MSYQCPLCQHALHFANNQYRCENNHQFDNAKEGYVNLMPAHHKRSKNPGDNKEMMQARRAFLEAGHYQPMQQQVANLCQQYITDDSASLLDIGCGEGYYTSKIAEQLDGENTNVFGLDISKVAIKYAAKRYLNCQFSVASSHRLPFSDLSLDGIVRIYAPCKAEELHRTIKDNGYLITVTPASHHLYELREGVYGDVRLHDEEAEEIAGFDLIEEKKLTYDMHLNGLEALHLLDMTPFAWKATAAFKGELKEKTAFDCKADFMIRVYKKS
ncbi:ribosomal RNA large subunit methyltransferase A [Aliivibrio wodanis]|uniref:Ribosomal RNA large subunit methyltransferase A n=1 Tax=Aliivibrio wodanis TaxID=80852 RepID=A0A090IRL1_9GAMM|nr:ribosomal RNA large subunit methyltransferase A [Aliivibrio wodanis]